MVFLKLLNSLAGLLFIVCWGMTILVCSDGATAHPLTNDIVIEFDPSDYGQETSEAGDRIKNEVHVLNEAAANYWEIVSLLVELQHARDEDPRLKPTFPEDDMRRITLRVTFRDKQWMFFPDGIVHLRDGILGYRLEINASDFDRLVNLVRN